MERGRPCFWPAPGGQETVASGRGAPPVGTSTRHRHRTFTVQSGGLVPVTCVRAPKDRLQHGPHGQRALPAPAQDCSFDALGRNDLLYKWTARSSGARAPRLIRAHDLYPCSCPPRRALRPRSGGLLAHLNSGGHSARPVAARPSPLPCQGLAPAALQRGIPRCDS
jgi:hypothetical protein